MINLMADIRGRFKEVLGKVVDTVLDYPTDFGLEGNNSSFAYVDHESTTFEQTSNRMLLGTVMMAVYVHTVGADQNGSRIGYHEQVVADVMTACLSNMQFGLSFCQGITPASIQANTTVIAAELREAQSAFQASKLTFELLTVNER